MNKFERCPFRRLCGWHRLRRDPSTVFAVWYFFSIFLFENTNFYWKISYLYLESSSASRKWKNSNVVLFADPAVHSVRTDPSVTLKKQFFFEFYQKKFKIPYGNCIVTNSECINRKTDDYMSRMALEKDDFRRFSVIWEVRVTGNWVAASVTSREKMSL